MVQSKACCCLPWLDFQPVMHRPFASIHIILYFYSSSSLPGFTSLILVGMNGGVLPCLINSKRFWWPQHQGQPTYDKQCRIHSPAQNKQREMLLLDLTEWTTWMQTDPALQSEAPEWGVLFDLIPAMHPEPHAYTDFTGITWGRCLHWGYSTTQGGKPLRMPKVWIFPW